MESPDLVQSTETDLAIHLLSRYLHTEGLHGVILQVPDPKHPAQDMLVFALTGASSLSDQLVDSLLPLLQPPA
jgi:hypothetical protein